MPDTLRGEPGPSRHRLKHASFAALTMVGALLVFAVAAEGGLALYKAWRWRQDVASLPPLSERCFVPSADPVLRWELNPGFRKGEFTVNSEGMADRERARSKPPGTFRIAFAGDSITANFNLVPRPQIYSSVLERQLDERVAPGLDVEALNFGVNGYGIEQTARVVTTKIGPFEPDIVVVQLCLNDPHPSGMPGLEHERVPGLRLKAFVERRLSPTRFWGELYAASNFDREGRTHVAEGLAAIADWSRRESRPVLLVLFPYLYRPAYEEWGFARYHELLAERAAGEGLAWLDLYASFEAAGLLDVPGADPIHPNAEGHALAAREIVRALEHGGWLDAVLGDSRPPLAAR